MRVVYGVNTTKYILIYWTTQNKGLTQSRNCIILIIGGDPLLYLPIRDQPNQNFQRRDYNSQC